MRIVMAGIVATLMLPPLAGLAWLACLLLRVPFEWVVTFGGALEPLPGVLAWWARVERRSGARESV